MNSRIKLITVVCLVGLALPLIAADKTQVLAPFFKVLGKLQVGQRISAQDSLILFNSTYGFRDSSGVIQFRGSADSKWRVLSDTVGGTGDEVTITKDAGTGELSFKAPYKAYADTSNALWMGFTSDNPMLYDGMRNQMFYANRTAIYDSAGYDKIIHYAKSNATERFTIVLTDTIFHRGVNDTIPSNIYLISQDRAGIWMNSDDSLYFDCRMEAGRYTVFHNGFSIQTTTKLQKIWYPEWRGVITVSTATNTTTYTEEMQQVFLDAYYMTRATVLQEPARYYVVDSLWIPNGVGWDVEGDGFGYLFVGKAPSDTVIVWGGTKWPWPAGAPPHNMTTEGWGSGSATESKIGNIYIRGTRDQSGLSNEEKVLFFGKRPAIGARMEHTQLWYSNGAGLLLYACNAGPMLLNVWCMSNDDTGLWVSGSGLFGYHVDIEGNAYNGSAANSYNLYLECDNSYIHGLHMENHLDKFDTLIYAEGASNNYISSATLSIVGDSVTIYASDNSSSVHFDKLINYNYTGNIDYSRLYQEASSVIAGGYTSFPYAKYITPEAKYTGIPLVWRMNLGGSDDIAVAPGDTVDNWLGYLGIYTRRSNKIGGYYSTYLLDPPYYINKTGTVWPFLPAVPLTSADTTSATSYTGDTNTADSLATVSNALEDLKDRHDKLWRKFKLCEQD